MWTVKGSMPTNPKKLLIDAIEAGEAINRHCSSKTRDVYLADEVLRGFVERKLLIIGEALARLRQEHPAKAERITDVNRIIGQRNRIVHGYDAVDDFLIWDAVRNHLPVLLSQMESLLKEEID